MIFSKGNFKGITVKYFHRFLNKSVTISVEQRGTNDMFVPTGINVGYVQNSAHVNGIYILRSILTIGHELYFSLDINLNTLPITTRKNSQSMLDYPKLIYYSRYFSSAITGSIHNNRNVTVLTSCKIFMNRTDIQIDISKKKVKQLCYTIRYQFYIIRNTGHDRYSIKKPNKPDSLELKFIAYNLYPLHLFLKYYTFFDTTSSRYLN